MLELAALKATFNTWWRTLLGAAIVAGPCFALGYCHGKDVEASRTNAAVAVATVETLKTDGNAKGVAANERLADNVAIAERKEQLTDAVSSLPDTTPSLRRVALACARLRAQGMDTAALPACR